MQSNAELVFPLVGEFSAGKTTLINALTDCKKLETATKPTTATIYEIHFGRERCHATVISEKGEEEEVEDIASLKNEVLADAMVVNIFDTSTRIPSTTVLVDTPGLSSPNPKHKQTLVDFLPHADGILLVTDVNQQITRSLTDFIETMKLSNRPIYLVITKCDTKSKQEVEQVKQYISDNCHLPINQMACVSVVNDDLGELLALLEAIQKDKDTILAQANGQRVKNIVAELSAQIDEFLNSSQSDTGLAEAIRQQEYELRRLNNNIDKLISEVQEGIKDKETEINRRFEDTVSFNLETLVAGRSNNFDAEAQSLINSTASLMLEDYKSQIRDVLRDKARESKNTENNIPLHSLTELDLSELTINGLSYNLSLNTLGHQYDKNIATATKVVAAVAAAAAVVATAGAATPAVAAGTTTTAIGTAKLIDVADTVSDVGSILSNRRTRTAIKEEAALLRTQQIATQLAKNTQKNMVTIEAYDQQAGQAIGSNKGIVESLVGLVTEETMGKPQRQRAIREYMYSTLMPRFKQKMEYTGTTAINLMSEHLHQEAAGTIAQKEEALRQLRKEQNENKSQFEQQRKQLKEYSGELKTL